MEKEAQEKKPGLHDNDDDGAENEGAVAADEAAATSPSPPSWWWLSFFTDARPCSLLQHVARACAGCLMDLCGGGSAAPSDRRPGSTDEDAADDDGDPAPVSQGDTSEEGSKATHDWAGGARLLARRRPPPGRPGRPRPGRGGSHN